MQSIPIAQWSSYVDAEFPKAGADRKLNLKAARAALSMSIRITASGLIKQAISEKALVLDDSTTQRVANMAPQFAAQAFHSLAYRIKGIYKPQDWEISLPSFETAPPTPATEVTPKVKISELLELWRKDHVAAHKSPRTVRDWTQKVGDFIAWLTHDDALQVTPKKVTEYCSHLQDDRGLAPATVSNKYLACIGSIFKVGVAKHIITVDPTEKVSWSVPKGIKVRTSGFTDAEAAKVLNATLKAPSLSSRWSPMNKLACRWLPWICAYTGARPGEIAQLRRADILESHGIHYFNISPEAGTVKTGQYRYVPVHPHLIEMGFIDFVDGRPDGPIFYLERAKQKGEIGVNSGADQVVKKVGQWVRETVGIDDPRIKPNHAWRHRFKTIGRAVGINVIIR